MKLPRKINPCPIVDALLEIRFSCETHPSAVFGVIYNALQKDFPKVENLPILQIPDVIRASDPNFRFKPQYKISNDIIVVQIGSDVLSISSYPKYIGWDTFSEKIFDIIEKIEKAIKINVVSRLGIRYINFFENNIFDFINLRVAINDKNIDPKNTIIRTEIANKDFISTLQIANNANNNSINGSLIDIDTFKDSGLENFLVNKKEIINLGHVQEKELFFRLLKVEFLKSLNPTY